MKTITCESEAERLLWIGLFSLDLENKEIHLVVEDGSKDDTVLEKPETKKRKRRGYEA